MTCLLRIELYSILHLRDYRTSGGLSGLGPIKFAILINFKLLGSKEHMLHSKSTFKSLPIILRQR